MTLGILKPGPLRRNSVPAVQEFWIQLRQLLDSVSLREKDWPGYSGEIPTSDSPASSDTLAEPRLLGYEMKLGKYND